MTRTSEVGPDDFCRSCYGTGQREGATCLECNGRGHSVRSRPDAHWRVSVDGRALTEICGRLEETAAVLRNGGDLDRIDRAGLIRAAELARGMDQ